MFNGAIGLSVGKCDMSVGMLKFRSLAPPPLGLEEGVLTMFAKSGLLAKSMGRSMLGREGEKVLRFGLKGSGGRLPGVSSGGRVLFGGVAALAECGVDDAPRFCGIDWGASDLGLASPLVALLDFRLWRLLLSPFSKTTRAIRSNSELTLSIRFTPPCSSVTERRERKLTTWFINRTSERARGSCGFWSMLAKRVTRAETGK